VAPDGRSEAPDAAVAVGLPEAAVARPFGAAAAQASPAAEPDAAVVAARANLRAGAPDRARNWLRRALEAGASAAAVRADPELGSLA